jgi:hypothetical protein
MGCLIRVEEIFNGIAQSKVTGRIFCDVGYVTVINQEAKVLAHV